MQNREDKGSTFHRDKAVDAPTDSHKLKSRFALEIERFATFFAMIILHSFCHVPHVGKQMRKIQQKLVRD